MRAVALERYLPVGDPDCLIDVELPAPVPQDGELLVRVSAVSVNPIDTKVRAPAGREHLRESPPRVLGFDAAGTVEAVGPGCEEFSVGDRVFYAGAINRPGSNAELQLVAESLVGPAPATWDFADSAALPLTALTAWEAIFEHLALAPAASDEPNPSSQGALLVIGGAGGVGSVAVQLAHWAGATVLATAGRDESARWVLELGADHVLDRRGDVVAQMRELGYTHVERIFCTARTDLWWESMAETVAPMGRICGIVDAASPLNLNLLKPKSASFSWEFMFTRSSFRTPDMAEQGRILSHVSALADAGILRSTRTRTVSPISAANLRQVHADVESGQSIGKTVLAGWY